MPTSFARSIHDDSFPYVLVVGGSPETIEGDAIRRLARLCNHVVAVDRGLDVLVSAGVGCDLLCGDFDSVSEGARVVVCEAESDPCDPCSIEVERYDPHKDNTDLSLALRAISERWGDVALVFTCLSGGREDHALAALGCMARWNGPVAWFERGFSSRILKAGDDWILEGLEGSTFSFVGLSPSAEVSEEGMEWMLSHRCVGLLEDLGISNVLSSHARFACHDGVVAAFMLPK